MKFVVKNCSWYDEYLIDDVLRKLAIRSLKRRKNNKKFIVSVVTECSAGRTTIIFNTYHLLKSAGMPEKAERLRKGFLENFDLDLSKEPKQSK